MIGNIGSIAASGLNAAARQAATAAHNTANLNTDGYEAVRESQQAAAGAGVSTGPDRPTGASQPVTSREGQEVSLSSADPGTETIRRLSASHAFAANLATLRAEDEKQESLLRIVA